MPPHFLSVCPSVVYRVDGTQVWRVNSQERDPLAPQTHRTPHPSSAITAAAAPPHTPCPRNSDRHIHARTNGTTLPQCATSHSATDHRPHCFARHTRCALQLQ